MNFFCKSMTVLRKENKVCQQAKKIKSFHCVAGFLQIFLLGFSLLKLHAAITWQLIITEYVKVSEFMLLLIRYLLIMCTIFSLKESNSSRMQSTAFVDDWSTLYKQQHGHPKTG